MTDLLLERTGDRPLAFTGEQLATANTRDISGKEANRWHELALYRAEDGTYILSIGWRTQWAGELSYDEVFTRLDVESLVDLLRAEYDPIGRLVGFPSGERYEEKQARLERDLTTRYQAAVSILLAALPPERLEKNSCA